MAGAGGDEVSITLTEGLLIFLIVFSLFIEVLLHRLERWISHHHVHLQAVLRNLYRELMVLGLVTFVFVLYEAFGKPELSAVHAFEWAHIFIFVFALFYTLVVVISMLISLGLSKRWKRMEQMDLINYLELKDQYRRLRSSLHRHHGALWRVFQWWFPNPTLPWRYWNLHEIMAFHDIRFQFIYYRNLPEDFRFSSYLRKIKSVTFIELVEAHWSLHVWFLGIVLVDITRRQYYKNPNFEPAFVIAAASLLIFVVTMLAVKIRRVYWQLTKHPATYYDTVDPKAFAAQMHAQEVRRGTRAARRRSLTGGDSPIPGPHDDPGNVADDEFTDRDHPSRASMISRPSHEAHSGSQRITNLVYHEATPDDRQSRDKRSKPVTREAPPLEDTAARHSIELRRPGLAGRNASTEHLPTEARLSGSSRSLEPLRRGHSSALDLEEAALRRSMEYPGRDGGDGVAMDVSSGEQPAPSDEISPAQMAAAPAAGQRGADVRLSLDDYQRPSHGDVSHQSLQHSSQRGSIDGPQSSSLGAIKSSRGSLGLVSALPREELVQRHHTARFDPLGDIEAGIVDGGRRSTDAAPVTSAGGSASPSAATGQRRMRVNFLRKSQDAPRKSGHGDGTDTADVRAQPSSSLSALRRNRSLRFFNASIVKNLQQHEEARNQQPAYYPHWMIKLFPRLGRVASPVEKLFWFGSHKFFLWCVEWTLFFATVLLSAACASFAANLRSDALSISGLTIAGLVMSAAALLYVLLRIADIMKKYIFILNNAGLVTEGLAIQAIHNVRMKRHLKFEVYGADGNGSDTSGSEEEVEESEAARERRRKMWRFFQNEAQSGNVRGIAPAGDSEDTGNSEISAEQLVRQKIASQRRRKSREERGPVPLVPLQHKPDSFNHNMSDG